MKILVSTDQQKLIDLMNDLNQNANIKEGNTTTTLCNINKSINREEWWFDLDGAIKHSNGGLAENQSLVDSFKIIYSGIVQELEKTKEELINDGYIEVE